MSQRVCKHINSLLLLKEENMCIDQCVLNNNHHYHFNDAFSAPDAPYVNNNNNDAYNLNNNVNNNIKNYNNNIDTLYTYTNKHKQKPQELVFYSSLASSCKSHKYVRKKMNIVSLLLFLHVFGIWKGSYTVIKKCTCVKYMIINMVVSWIMIVYQLKAGGVEKNN